MAFFCRGLALTSKALARAFTHRNSQQVVRTFTATRPSFQNAAANNAAAESQSEPSNKSPFSAQYKKSLRKLFLKIHPDVFASQKELQSVNMRSYQDLNVLLDWINEFTRTYGKVSNSTKVHLLPRLPPPLTKLQLTFYCRESNASSTRSDTQQVRFIHAHFQLPAQFEPSKFLKVGHTSPRKLRRLVSIAQDSVDKCLLALLRHAEIDTPTVDRRAEFAAESAALNDTEPAAARVKSAFELDLDAVMDENQQQDSEAAAVEVLPTLEELIQSNMLFFASSLGEEQIMHAMERFGNLLPQMHFHSWSKIPVLVTEHNQSDASGVNDTVTEHLRQLRVSFDKKTGFLNLPYDFTIEEFNEFLVQQLADIRAHHKKTFESIVRLQDLTDTLRRTYHIDKISVFTASRDDAIAFIERFLSDEVRSAIMQSPTAQSVAPIAKLQGQHIGISDDRLRIMPDGCIVIPHHIKSLHLVTFLRQEDISLSTARRVHHSVHRIAESIILYASKALHRLRCKEIDINNIETAPTATHTQKLDFVQRLYYSSMFLADVNLSGYTIRMADPRRPLEVDFDNLVIEIPSDFNAPKLTKLAETLIEAQKRTLKYINQRRGNITSDELTSAHAQAAASAAAEAEAASNNNIPVEPIPNRQHEDRDWDEDADREQQQQRQYDGEDEGGFEDDEGGNRSRFNGNAIERELDELLRTMGEYEHGEKKY